MVENHTEGKKEGYKITVDTRKPKREGVKRLVIYNSLFSFSYFFKSLIVDIVTDAILYLVSDFNICLPLLYNSTCLLNFKVTVKIVWIFYRQNMLIVLGLSYGCSEFAYDVVF